jgi:hypothetical protein
MVEIETEQNNWFQKWSWKIVGWATICFLGLSCVNGLFSFLLDVLLFENKFGYGYSYFALLFYTLILYFFYAKTKSNWIGVFAFGLCGIVGIPIEIWLEVYRNPVLKGIWAAFAWGGIYILYGLAADLSIMLVKVIKKEVVAFIVSALIFSTIFLFINIIPLKLFYVQSTPIEGAKNYFYDGYYLIPIAIIEGIIGAITGYFLANELKKDKQNS